MFLMLNRNDYEARSSFGDLGITRRRGLRRSVALCNGQATWHNVHDPGCIKTRTKGTTSGWGYR
jgi:hypothetical protein